MIIRIIFLILVTMMALTPPCTGEIYQWTDTRGIKHFSNITPSASTPTRTVKERSAYPTKKSKAPQGPFFKVVKVYDGDSIKVAASNKRSASGSGLTFMVRLAGIDAPESSYKRQPGQPFSQEAKQMLISLVAGKEIELKGHGMGAYNRQLAEVFAEGVNVNLAMVTAGMAEIYRGNSVRGLDMDRYRRAQDEAKRAYRGIWNLGSNYQSPRAWRKAHPRKR